MNSRDSAASSAFNYHFEVFPPLSTGCRTSPTSRARWVKIFREDPQVLLRLAEQVEQVIPTSQVSRRRPIEDHARRPQADDPGQPARAGLLGLSPQEVAEAIELTIFEVQNRHRRRPTDPGLRAFYPKSERRTEEQVRRLPVHARGGRIVRLEEVADVREEPGIFAVVPEGQRPDAAGGRLHRGP